MHIFSFFDILYLPDARLAQLVEHSLDVGGVADSSSASRTYIMNNTSEQKNKYPTKTAGHLMTELIPVYTESVKISDIISDIQTKAETFESIQYIYCILEDKTIAGVVSLKELFQSNKTETLRQQMHTNTISAHPHTHQERIAQLAITHRIKQIPIINTQKQLLGVVTSESIFKILHNEHIEDVLHLAGITDPKEDHTSFQNTPLKISLWRRFPWLAVGLLGGILASFIVTFFESTLHEMLILAAFIPAVVYMADAVGSQAQMLFIRSLATDHNMIIGSYIREELKIGTVLAICLGLIIFLYGFFFYNIIFAVILGVSLSSTVVLSVVIALGLPFLLNKVHIDPAVASGPFATVLRDIFSILIYFAVASGVLGMVA
jgi:magnesium transporter